MNKYYKRSFKKNDNKKIFLYGYKEHKEVSDKQLKIKNFSKPHMRWQPFRQEWVTYSSGREERISFPSKDLTLLNCLGLYRTTEQIVLPFSSW